MSTCRCWWLARRRSNAREVDPTTAPALSMTTGALIWVSDPSPGWVSESATEQDFPDAVIDRTRHGRPWHAEQPGSGPDLRYWVEVRIVGGRGANRTSTGRGKRAR